MTTRSTKRTNSIFRRHLAIALMRGDTSIPGVKEILQSAPSSQNRIGYDGKQGTRGFSPSFGTTSRTPGGAQGAKTLVINAFVNTTTSKGREKAKHPHNITHRMTRAWAENLAGQWLRESNYEI
jgi:hypothetical protein